MMLQESDIKREQFCWLPSVLLQVKSGRLEAPQLQQNHDIRYKGTGYEPNHMKLIRTKHEMINFDEQNKASSGNNTNSPNLI